MPIDFQSIQDAISFAGDTGSAVGKLAKTAEAIQKLFSSSKVGADPEIKLAMSELMFQIADSKASNAQLINRLTTLEAALEAAQAVQADFDRYELWKAPAGAVVYRLKEGDSTGEPGHFLCPNCMEDKRKSILQGNRVVKCTRCTTAFRIESDPPRKRDPNKWRK